MEATVSSTGGPEHRPGGGPGGQAPVSSEDPAVEIAEKWSKNYQFIIPTNLVN